MTETASKFAAWEWKEERVEGREEGRSRNSLYVFNINGFKVTQKILQILKNENFIFRTAAFSFGKKNPKLTQFFFSNCSFAAFYTANFIFISFSRNELILVCDN